MANDAASQRTPDEVQHEIEQTRAELDSPLDEIGKRLSPHEMKERAVDYVKDGASRIGDTVQRNPVPVALTGTLLAAALLARRRLHVREAREREEQFRAVWDRVSAAIERPHAFSRAGGTVSEALGKAVARTGEAALDAREGLARLVGEAGTRAQSLVAAGRSRALVESIEEASRERPFLALGVALAAGALLATLIRR
jgi:ElaB/YqjD/DUF883 family membrane-anchored ribosome-binding protein